MFHVKAFGVMTRHPVRLEQLPPDLRDAVEVGRSGRVERPPREVREEVFARFHRALEPLREAGKLGGILMQFPPYVVPRPESFAYLEWAQEQLGDDEMLVEFRHRAWLDDEHRDEVLAFLEERGATIVIVDAPRSEAKNLLPTVVATTSPTAYVRMHGRNAKTWNIRGTSAAERFDYLYSEDELGEWVEPLRELSRASESAYVLFNNNGRSAVPAPFAQSRLTGESDESEQMWVAQAPENAVMLRGLLERADVPVILTAHFASLFRMIGSRREANQGGSDGEKDSARVRQVRLGDRGGERRDPAAELFATRGRSRSRPTSATTAPRGCRAPRWRVAGAARSRQSRSRRVPPALTASGRSEASRPASRIGGVSLALLVGPANAGKVATLLDRYVAALDREPCLVVPNRGEVERIERDLLTRVPALLGGWIGTFDDLAARIARRPDARDRS